VSVEHHQEHAEQNEQAAQELEAARREKLEELRNQPETRREDSNERADEARKFINKVEATPEPPPEPEATPKQSSVPFLDHKLNYAQTLASMQRHLSPVSRAFSEVIHAPIVEKTSEALEKTIARPSITVGATWTALIIGSVFYFTARHYGFELSGSEMTLSFVVGAIIGLALEGFWRSLRRRRMQ
jgi:hypothetical protein